MALPNSIFNLTRHEATTAQIEDGLLEPSAEIKERIKDLLTFDKGIPTIGEVKNRLKEISGLLIENSAPTRVLISGPIWLMGPLERKLRHHGYIPVYSKHKVKKGKTNANRVVPVVEHLCFFEGFTE